MIVEVLLQPSKAPWVGRWHQRLISWWDGAGISHTTEGVCSSCGFTAWKTFWPPLSIGPLSTKRWASAVNRATKHQTLRDPRATEKVRGYKSKDDLPHPNIYHSQSRLPPFVISPPSVGFICLCTDVLPPAALEWCETITAWKTQTCHKTVYT